MITIHVHTDDPITPEVIAQFPENGLIIKFGPHVATLDNLTPLAATLLYRAFSTPRTIYLPHIPFGVAQRKGRSVRMRLCPRGDRFCLHIEIEDTLYLITNTQELVLQ